MIEENLKFVKKDDLTERFDSLITKNVFLDHSLDFNTTFNPLEITKCPRRIMYRIRGDSYDTRISEVMRISCIKDKWIKYFDYCPSIKLLAKNFMVADCNFNITGTIDAILNIEEKNIVCQIKPVCDVDFIELKKKGAIKKHIIEILIYMWLAELQDGLLVYDNQNNGEYLTFHIEPYPVIIKSVKEKCFELNDKMVKRQLPDRPYKTKDSKECSMCYCVEKCWL